MRRTRGLRIGPLLLTAVMVPTIALSALGALGVQRVYTRDGELDEAYAVRDCDAVLVPKGYHPFVAAHGYDCYYLNALAGDVPLE